MSADPVSLLPLREPDPFQQRAMRIAVLVPCYNEAESIATVIRDFRQALPTARVYVYDNNSTDGTCEIARRAGGIVRQEPRQGKGHVVRRMFSDIDADVYVLVDGDATYHAPAAGAMIDKLLRENLDMVVGCRVEQAAAAYRNGHRFGNAMLTGFVGHLFGRQFRDILSGYRVFSRRFVKTFPALAEGFETETEITVHALELKVPIGEVDTPYGARGAGSVQQAQHLSRRAADSAHDPDALSPRATDSLLRRRLRSSLLVAAVVLAWPLFVTFYETGQVPRVPTAVLCTGLVISALLSFACGLILDTVTRGRQELKRLAYLSIPASAHVAIPAAVAAFAGFAGQRESLRVADVIVCAMLLLSLLIRTALLTGPVGSDDLNYFRFAQQLLQWEHFSELHHHGGRLVFLALIGLPAAAFDSIYAGVAANIAMLSVRDILIVCYVRKRLDTAAAISAAGILGFNAVSSAYAGLMLPDGLLSLCMFLAAALAFESVRADGGKRLAAARRGRSAGGGRLFGEGHRDPDRPVRRGLDPLCRFALEDAARRRRWRRQVCSSRDSPLSSLPRWASTTF